jgi:uncharacterized protein involved in outer membrane biogenesis
MGFVLQMLCPAKGTAFADSRTMTPTSRNRWRKAAWPLGILAVLVAAVGVAEWRGWPFLKGPLESRLAERLQRDVRLGDEFALKLFGSLRLKTNALHVGPPRGPDADPALGGDLVDASDAWLEVPYSTVRALMKHDSEQAPRITAIRVGRAEASLKRLPDGRANWQFAPPRKAPSGPPVQFPEVDELVVQNGHIVVQDGLLKSSLDATVQTREGDKPASGAQKAEKAGLLVEGKGRHEDMPFEFHVTAAGVLPLVARANPTAVPVTIRLDSHGSKFAFEGTATDVLSLEGLDGSAALSGPSLAAVGDAVGVTLPTTAPFTLHGRLAKTGDVWSLKRIDLDVGESRLGGDFSFDRRARPPLLNGELTGSRMVLADLLPAFGAPIHGAPNPKPPPGHVLPQREFDIPSLKAMNANVKVRLQRADLGTLFRQPLQPLQGDLSLERGVLKLSNVLARTSGGELKGGIGLDSNPATPLWNVDMRWAGVELDQFLRPRNKVTREVKPSGEKPAYVTGKLGGHAQLTARGNSTAKLIASLDGTVQGWVRDGTISHVVVEAAGIDVAQALGVMIMGDDRLPMSCAAVRAVAKGGVVTPEVAIIKDSTLFVTGNVALVDERLALTLTSKPKDMSPAALRSPVHVDGTFGHPQLHLEKKPIALKLLAAAALGAVTPLAALIPLFDPGDKEAAGGCQRTLAQLRDANGPAGAPASKAPKPTDANVPADNPRHAAASAPLRK